MKLAKHHRIIPIVALLTIAIDQLQKWHMLDVVGIASRPPIQVTDFFALGMVWNKGVSFGMLNNPDWSVPHLLSAMAVIVSAVLLYLALKTSHRAERIGYAMVIGGALGNVIDRLRFGAVADFFYFHIGDLGWPAFNIADSAIFLGVCLLLYQLFTQPSKP